MRNVDILLESSRHILVNKDSDIRNTTHHIKIVDLNKEFFTSCIMHHINQENNMIYGNVKEV